MPLTPLRGFTPNQSQQYAAQTTTDPMQSPVAKLRGNLTEMYRRGLDPMAVEAQYQGGMAQQQALAEESGGFNPMQQAPMGPAYSNAIPSMRNNLMKLQQPKLQQPRFAIPNTRAQY